MTKKRREGGPALRVRTAVFILKGRLDAGQAQELAAALASTDVSVRRVVLDLSAVILIGPEALAVLQRESDRVAVAIGDRVTQRAQATCPCAAAGPWATSSTPGRVYLARARRWRGDAGDRPRGLLRPERHQ